MRFSQCGKYKYVTYNWNRDRQGSWQHGQNYSSHSILLRTTGTVNTGSIMDIENCNIRQLLNIVLNRKLFPAGAGADPGGAPPTTKNEAPAPKFYKIEAPE